MTGVVKSVGKYALLAGSALALSISAASAASMAKAGMDKRVADLEREVTLLKNQMKSAMMAKPADKNIQSGNSRVKVTIYGQVNRAVRYAASGSKNDIHSVDNTESNSRLGVRAVGKLNAGTTAVAWSEWAMETGGNRLTGFSEDGSQGNGGNLSMRHSVVDISHKDMGTLSLGHSSRADASAIFTGFQGTGIVFNVGTTGYPLLPESDVDGVADKKIVGGRIGHPTNVNPGRENRILVRSPNLMGASLAASYNQAKSWSVGGSFKSPASLSKEVSVALGFGFRSQPAKDSMSAAMTTIGVSGGVQHNPSGLSVNGVWAQESVKGYKTAATKASTMRVVAPNGGAAVDVITPAEPAGSKPGYKHSGWAADVSWTGKVADFGSTSFTVGYGQYREGSHKQTKGYWVALNQSVDSAAADVYLGASYDTGRGEYTVAHTKGSTADGTTMSYLDADATDGTAAKIDKTCGAVPLATPDTAAETDYSSHNGTMCSVARKPVLVFLAGVRVKF